MKRALTTAKAVALVLLAACSSSPPPKVEPKPIATTPIAADAGAAEPTPSLDSKDSKQVAKTLVTMSELRGIAATRPVPGVKLGRDQLVGKVKEKALREYPPEVLRREGQLLQLMGFAPATFDYLGEMLKLLEAQLEGFYEPKNGTMYLAADLRKAQAQATLAHELVHALQDQRWDLKKRSLYKPGQGDESLALACLAEGDATSSMLDFILRPEKTAIDADDDALQEMMRASIDMGDTRSVPHILKTTLVAPYLEGLAFTHALRRKGGWEGVNRAWDRIPTTTEQILHVAKWEANEPALAIPPPTGATLGEGWKREDEDTFGELGFGLTYEEWMGHDDARAAAANWGGDREATFAKGDEIAFAVHERYDAAPAPNTSAHAEKAFGKISAGLKKFMGQKPAIAEANVLCFERKDTGPLLVARKDRDYVMIAGPAKVGKTAWTSSGTCATAKKWSDEIFAQK